MKLVMVAAIYLSVIVSCQSTFYQVYEVDTDNLKQQENSLVYENEDCKVLYNLWSNGGEIKFAVVNKTDRDLFINMGQSFFVKNGFTTDYYQVRTFTKQIFSQDTDISGTASAMGATSGFWGDNIYIERAKATSYSVTTNVAEIICVPAKCYKLLNYYMVNPSWKKTCDRDKDFPIKNYLVDNYSKTNSPIIFKNRITYGFTKNEAADKHIDNIFWITAITNYSEKAATENVEKQTECYEQNSTFKQRLFKIAAPNKFYIKMKGTNSKGVY